MNRKGWLLAAASFFAISAQATCYGVYRADGTLLQETATTPVDLSHPLGDTVPEKFGPGASMIISDGLHCLDRAQEPRAPGSLAAAVQAEEEKAMLVKVPVAVADPAAARAAQDVPARVQVVKQEGNVLKIKGKEAQ
jgi:hypothetical protein